MAFKNFISTKINGFKVRIKCPYLELFWSAFSHIRTEYGEIPRISQYPVQMRENVD